MALIGQQCTVRLCFQLISPQWPAGRVGGAEMVVDDGRGSA